MSSKRSQAGMTLVEVLITVVILASGLLGMAALQTRSISYNNIAYFNSLSNILAYDMLDRIKANPVYGLNGPGYSASVGNVPAAYPDDCDTADCTPAELARYDVAQWKFILDTQLPDSDGSIVKTDTPEGRNYTITIFFDDSKGQQPRRQVILRSTL
ncbi:type IV pilus modification protein PilV [Endozoicomonas sp. ALD040]|uniref:type IV pilus modification protein PilV n=1 Tax=unclassified Endozoicomonas TaxID=2644528 RepID=UPI003BB0F494